MNDNDGVALNSIAHPRPTLLKRLWVALFPPQLHSDALESVVIDSSKISGAGLRLAAEKDKGK